MSRCEAWSIVAALGLSIWSTARAFDTAAPAPPSSGAALAHVLETEQLLLAPTDPYEDRGLLTGMELRAPQFRGPITASDRLRLAATAGLWVDVVVGTDDARPDQLELRGAGPRFVEFGWRRGGLDVAQRLELIADYRGVVTVTVANTDGRESQHHVRVTTHVARGEGKYDESRGLCGVADGIVARTVADLDDAPTPQPTAARWGGVDTKYFGVYVVPQAPTTSACEVALEPSGALLVDHLSTAPTTLGPGASTTYRFAVYVGAKEIERLEAFDATLGEPVGVAQAVDWGAFGEVSRGLGTLLLGALRWAHRATGSWGLAIVVLTILVKVATIPFTLRRFVVKRRLEAIRPEIERIRAAHRGNRRAQRKELRVVFARAGIHPLALLVPTLVQLPILLAVYAVLSSATELVNHGFLWIPDLSREDPYFALPMGIGGLLLLQSWSSSDPLEGKSTAIVRWCLPVLLPALMWLLPSGLGLYILTGLLTAIVVRGWAGTAGRARSRR